MRADLETFEPCREHAGGHAPFCVRCELAAVRRELAKEREENRKLRLQLASPRLRLVDIRPLNRENQPQPIAAEGRVV